MTQPFNVRIFLVDGDPAGIKVVEKSNWAGGRQVYPQSLFGKAKASPELRRTVVDVLVEWIDDRLRRAQPDSTGRKQVHARSGSVTGKPSCKTIVGGWNSAPHANAPHVPPFHRCAVGSATLFRAIQDFIGSNEMLFPHARYVPLE